MKFSIATMTLLLAGAALLLLAGCNDETVPDKHLVESANAQRAAMPAGGKSTAPPTGQPTTPAPATTGK